MLKSKMEQHPDVKGVIFDGFPRTIPQAEALDLMLAEMNTSISVLLSLKVEDQEIVARIQKRGLSSGRSDDNDPNVIQNRIDTYKSQTTPVFDYYSQQGKSKEIEGVGDIETIFQSLCYLIDSSQK